MSDEENQDEKRSVAERAEILANETKALEIEKDLRMYEEAAAQMRFKIQRLRDPRSERQIVLDSLRADKVARGLSADAPRSEVDYVDRLMKQFRQNHLRE